MKLLPLGGGNFLNTQRLVALVSPDSLPIRRLMQDAKNDGMLIDVSCGKKTRSVLITDSGHILCCAEETDTLQAYISTEENNA